MATLLASRLRRHFPVKHFPVAHFPVDHFRISEYIYSDAPHICFDSTWDLAASLSGTFVITVGLTGEWSEC